MCSRAHECVRIESGSCVSFANDHRKAAGILMGRVLGLRLHAVLLLGLLILALQCVQQGVPAFVERVRRVWDASPGHRR